MCFCAAAAFLIGRRRWHGFMTRIFTQGQWRTCCTSRSSIDQRVHRAASSLATHTRMRVSSTRSTKNSTPKERASGSTGTIFGQVMSIIKFIGRSVAERLYSWCYLNRQSRVTGSHTSLTLRGNERERQGWICYVQLHLTLSGSPLCLERTRRLPIRSGRTSKGSMFWTSQVGRHESSARRSASSATGSGPIMARLRPNRPRLCRWHERAGQLTASLRASQVGEQSAHLLVRQTRLGSCSSEKRPATEDYSSPRTPPHRRFGPPTALAPPV